MDIQLNVNSLNVYGLLFKNVYICFGEKFMMVVFQNENSYVGYVNRNGFVFC